MVSVAHRYSVMAAKAMQSHGNIYYSMSEAPVRNFAAPFLKRKSNLNAFPYAINNQYDATATVKPSSRFIVRRATRQMT